MINPAFASDVCVRGDFIGLETGGDGAFGRLRPRRVAGLTVATVSGRHMRPQALGRARTWGADGVPPRVVFANPPAGRYLVVYAASADGPASAGEIWLNASLID